MAKEKKTVTFNPPSPQVPLSECDFELDGKKYKFVIPRFRIPDINDGQPITALEAKVTPEALRYLVDNKSACIKELD